jgi:DNA-binding response OmpR family regulator
VAFLRRERAAGSPARRGRRGRAPASRELLQDYLEDQGFRVATAEDGAEALRRLAQPPGSVCTVVLDLTLPDVSGFTVLEEVRRSGTEAAVVAVSSNTVMLAEALQAGAQAAVAKPFDLTALPAAVRRYCPMVPG